MKKLFGVRTKLSYYKVFHRKSISNRNEKNSQILMNKLVFVGLSILELSKLLRWYGEQAKLCYMDTENFIVYIKTWYL